MRRAPCLVSGDSSSGEESIEVGGGGRCVEHCPHMKGASVAVVRVGSAARSGVDCSENDGSDAVEAEIEKLYVGLRESEAAEAATEHAEVDSAVWEPSW